MATRKAGRIFAGVGGWNFAPWRDNFYPEGLAQSRELEYASRQFTSIEINSTFYGLQKPATYQKWRDATPADFVFAMKAPRFNTHRKDLGAGASGVARFLDSGVTELGAKLGPINWQLDPGKAFDAAEIAKFLALLPHKHGGVALRHAIEPRHESFDCEEFVALAREHGVAVVESGDSEHPRIQAQTASFAYLRVMGSKPRLSKGFTPGALARWRDHARTLAKKRDVFFFFIGGAKERNPHAARALIAALGE